MPPPSFRTAVASKLLSRKCAKEYTAFLLPRRVLLTAFVSDRRDFDLGLTVRALNALKAEQVLCGRSRPADRIRSPPDAQSAAEATRKAQAGKAAPKREEGQKKKSRRPSIFRGRSKKSEDTQ